MLASLNREEPDYTPCSFMLYGALKSRCTDYTEFIERQVNMGLDTCVELPPRSPTVINDYYNLHGLPVHYSEKVQINEWIETLDGEERPVMIKEYHTPAGVLRTEVRQTDDWRWGNHVPFLDDYIVPRARKHLVCEPQDLERIRFLLVPPSPEEINAFRSQSAQAILQARKHDLLLTGGWGVGADLIGWICGLENMILLPYDQPAFFTELLNIVAEWNQHRMRVVLDAGIDLYIKRAWYENLDFFPPRSWRKYLFPILKADADLAHERGAKFGYIITSSCMPLLNQFVEAGVDVLLGVDPHCWNLEEAKRSVGDRICFWGGVNGHLTMELGSQDDVRAEVQSAMNVLAPGGGFILSPVDNVREDTSTSQANVQVLIAEYQHLTGQENNGTIRN